MSSKFIEWDEFEKTLNLTQEEEEEIRFEEELIEATIRAREEKKLTQRELSKLSGIKQPAIARLERRVNSPTVDTLMKLLFSMGYTLKVVPLEKTKK